MTKKAATRGLDEAWETAQFKNNLSVQFLPIIHFLPTLFKKKNFQRFVNGQSLYCAVFIVFIMVCYRIFANY